MKGREATVTLYPWLDWKSLRVKKNKKGLFFLFIYFNDLTQSRVQRAGLFFQRNGLFLMFFHFLVPFFGFFLTYFHFGWKIRPDLTPL